MQAFLSDKQKGSDHFEDQVVKGKIILDWIWIQHDVSYWAAIYRQPRI